MAVFDTEPSARPRFLPLVALLVLIFGACNGSIVPHANDPGSSTNGAPTVLPSVTPSSAPTPVPTLAQVTYRVRSGDTLGRIATRFKRTIGQLLTANPPVTDPNHIETGQLLVIPAADAPDIPPSIAAVQDPENDLADEGGLPTSGPGYADLLGFATRLGDVDLLMELQLLTTPPNVDPTAETITYTINIDSTGDGEPDYVVTYGNALVGVTGYAASLRNRSTGEELLGVYFPGSVEVTRTAIKISVALTALGSPDGTGTFAAAAGVQRVFLPEGPADSSGERSSDLAPDQQWPRPNPRWLIVQR